MILQEALGLDKSDGRRQMRVRGPDGNWMVGTGADGFMAPRDYAMSVVRTKHADMFQGDGVGGAGASSTNGASRRNVVQIKRSDINGKAHEVAAVMAQARKDGRAVEFVD
jgi:hypothetical protein